jgi:hypothetical protein
MKLFNKKEILKKELKKELIEECVNHVKKEFEGAFKEAERLEVDGRPLKAETFSEHFTVLIRRVYTTLHDTLLNKFKRNEWEVINRNIYDSIHNTIMSEEFIDAIVERIKKKQL